jgi:hypothetical protein
MQNDNEWEIVYQVPYYKEGNNFSSVTPITIYPPLSRHVIEVQVLADSIPDTWFSAGRLSCFLQDPNSSIYPRTTLIENVPINTSKVFKIPDDSEFFWLQYRPHYWFREQTLTVKTWIYG